MIQGSWKEHSHVSWTEQGKNLGGSVGQNIGKTKRTKRTISTIRMMEQGQDTWRGFGPSCLGPGKVWKYQKCWNGSRKDREGQGKELLPGNTSVRVYECYRT